MDGHKVIKDVFPFSNGMAKVVITSRNEAIGAKANVNRKPHMMRFLTPEESWELLRLEVLGKLIALQRWKKLGKF